MSILDLVTKSRSYRGFDEKRSITRQELLHFIDCARLSPSSVNLQVLKYYPVYQKALVQEVLAHTNWARGLPDLTLPHPGMGPTAFIVICQDTLLGKKADGFSVDIGASAQSILLCAVEQGLGGCMIANFRQDEMSTLLHLPEHIVPRLVIALGKPLETVVLTEVKDGKTAYYRDENDVHYVPKRSLEDLLLD